MKWEDIIDQIIRREGSVYTDDPSDKGGPTKYGITLATLSASRGHACGPADVQALSEDEARQIYHQNFVVAPGFWRINDLNLCGLLVDCGVNHGPGTAIRWLQDAIGVTRDGNLGRTTATLANSGNSKILFGKILCARIKFYTGMADRDSSQAKFETGWMNRCCEFVTVLAGM